jgi:hypothetical protein
MRHGRCFALGMSIRNQFQPRYSINYPEPAIPVKRMPLFMKALWLLAALMLVGIVYSFWRISSVSAPALEVPTEQNAPAQKN